MRTIGPHPPGLWQKNVIIPVGLFHGVSPKKKYKGGCEGVGVHFIFNYDHIYTHTLNFIVFQY